MSSSSKPTKRNTSSKAEAQPSNPSPSGTNANVPDDSFPTPDPTVQTSTSTARHAHAHAHNHEQQASTDGSRRKSTDSDLTTWAHLSLDRSGARVRTICTQDHENGETCSHIALERRYRSNPRVDGPSEKITVKGVEAMMASEARAERDSDGEGEEGWIVIERD